MLFLIELKAEVRKTFQIILATAVAAWL